MAIALAEQLQNDLSFLRGRSAISFQSISQTNFYSTHIPSVARLSGMTAESAFNSKSSSKKHFNKAAP